MTTHLSSYVGTYWRLWFLARALVKRGHEVTVVSVSRKNKWTVRKTIKDGVILWEGPNWLHNLPGKGTGPLDILYRANLIAKNNYDIIHAFEYHPNIRLPLEFSQSWKKTIVISDWCDWYSQGGLGPRWGKYRLLQRLVARLENGIRLKSHGITVISHCLYDQVNKQLGIPTEKILYLPGGAPADLIRPMDQHEARLKNGLGPEKIIGFLGAYQADLDLVVDAFKLVIQELPQCKLLVIGEDKGSRLDVLEKKIQAYGVKNKIIRTGFVDSQRLPSLLACADVFALPIRNTLNNLSRWPNKIGEYLAAGRPTVAHAVGEMKYLFEKYSIGLAVEQDDRAYANALLELLKNQAKAQQCGEQAREVAEQVLSWDCLSTELEAFYLSIKKGAGM